MATDLKPGNELPVRSFSAGMIIACKSTRFDLHHSAPTTAPRRATKGFDLYKPTPFELSLSGPTTASPSATHLDLYSVKNDIVLRITFRTGQNKVFFNDRADKSLLDGWGQEQSVDLNPVDVEKWRRSGVTISVHHSFSPTRSKEQYQILFDLTTVFYFDKRFPEPAIKLRYSVTTQSHQLSDPLNVLSYKLDDLPLVERQAIEFGIAPPSIPAASSTVIPIPSHNFFPKGPNACVSRDNGREIRHYRLGPGNKLQECIYLSKDGKTWHCEALHDLNIVLDSSSSIAAGLSRGSLIGIHYQDPDTDFIRILWKNALKGDWQQGRTITKALKGTKIAVVKCSDADGTLYSRIYYQGPHLHLIEYYFDYSKGNWVLGDFNPGEQPRGTCINAEAVHGGDVDITVSWRDERGHLVSSSRSKTLGWDLPKRASEREHLDGRD